MSLNRLGLLIIGHVGRAALVGGFCLGLATSAYAFEPTAEQREACTGDAFRLCSSAIPDIERTTACMKANEARLSPRCRTVFEAAGRSAEPTRLAHAHKTKKDRQARAWRHHLARS